MYQKWLQAFHFVAKEGTFTGAAKRLNVGQPTISTHVGNLEGRFGVELFKRQGRSISLTAAGISLFDITRDLYGHEQEAIDFLNDVKNLETGELRFSAVGPFDVMEILETLRKKRPGIRCTLRLGTIEDVVADLDEFRADIGIVGRDIESETIYSTFYNVHEVLVIVNKQHRLSDRTAISLNEIEGENMVIRGASSTTQKAFDSAACEMGIYTRPVINIESREGLREAIIRNLGIGVISKPEFAPHPALSAIQVSDAEIYTSAYIVCLKSRLNRALISETFQIAEEITKLRKTDRTF